MLVLCDGGGSNSATRHTWKRDRQVLADEIGVEVRVAHDPPYCSKYNPIEHRMFPHVTRACAGVVFDAVETARRSMARASTATGLSATADVLDRVYSLTDPSLAAAPAGSLVGMTVAILTGTGAGSRGTVTAYSNGQLQFKAATGGYFFGPPAAGSTYVPFNPATLHLDQTVYDAAGNAAYAVDPNGLVTAGLYNALG